MRSSAALARPPATQRRSMDIAGWVGVERKAGYCRVGREVLTPAGARCPGCRALRSFSWLTAGRAASLAGGCCALLAIMRRLGAQEVLVLEADLLDGLLHSAAGGEGGSRLP
jgi:hypothetical protein